MSASARPRGPRLTRLALKGRPRRGTTDPHTGQDSGTQARTDQPVRRTLLWVGPEADKMLPHLEATFVTKPLGESTDTDNVILVRSDDPRLIQSLCSAHPRACVVVLVSQGCPTKDVVSVLDAGADACFRDPASAELHAQLLAVLRRLDDKDRA